MTENAVKFRCKLIQEFRKDLTAEEMEPPVETEGVVVLSAPPVKGEDGQIIEASPENIVRIKWGIEVVRKLAAKRSGLEVEQITNETIAKWAPPLILNGDDIQIRMMARVAQELGFPKEKTEVISAGGRETANTRTQFEVMNTDPRWKEAKHLTFVTTAYHVPRVRRTAKKNLREGLSFEVIGVPLDRFPVDVFSRVRGEVRRIQQYSSRGDIAREP